MTDSNSSTEPEKIFSDPRRLGREAVVGLLYEADIKKLPIKTLLEQLPIPPDEHVQNLVLGIEQDSENLDADISSASIEWTLERMPSIDRAVLRLAAYELKHSDIPVAVILNEAIEIAKSYSTAESGKFVNGVLSTLAKKYR